MKNIIVFNSGSSSLKFSLYENKKLIIEGIVDSIKLKESKIEWKIYSLNKTKKDVTKNSKNNFKKYSNKIKINSHEKAFSEAINIIFSKIKKENISAIGHRVVHGGNYFSEPIIINEKNLKKLEKISFLAPLHNPHNIKGIKICSKIFKIPQIAVFDTGFHNTISKNAKTYPLPKNIIKKYHIRKYGFHGISYSYIVEQLKKLKRSKKIKSYKKTIICHMGNGISITAVKDGKSIETSMGFTPLDGMPMGTRIGSIDPGVILFLLKQGESEKKLEIILNKDSGLLALSGNSDMTIIHEKAIKGNKKAKDAISFISYNAFKIIGSYISILNGLDVLVFTGGMGEKAFYLRSKIISHLKYMKAKLDVKKNENNEMIISNNKSKIKILKIHTNEDLQIAKETLKLIS